MAVKHHCPSIEITATKII